MITRTNIWVATAVAILVAGLLTGCASPDTATSAHSVSPTPSETAAPATTDSPTVQPTSTPTPVPSAASVTGSIPRTCPALITAGTYKKSFAHVPLNDPSTVGSHPTAPTSDLDPVTVKGAASIFCVWHDPGSDITYLTIQVVTVNAATARGHLQNLAANGYTCMPLNEGYRCQKLSTNEQYKVDVGDTYFTRGNIGIRIEQANFPTTNLLAEVEANVFPTH